MTFLDTYRYHCGVSEVPEAFHRWTALALLAACAQDRVWVRKGASKIVPNLYVFLVGPSGVGKGEAIKVAHRLVAGLPVRLFNGRVTAAAMVDLLAQPVGLRANPKPHDARVWITTPELAMGVRSGALADDLIKLMTELYSGSDVPVPTQENTRMHGSRTIRNHCVNWMAGTTVQWLRDCVTPSAIESGFFARVSCVMADYDLDQRCPEPSVPADYDDAVRALLDHLRTVMHLSGEAILDTYARDVHTGWYMARPAPEREVLIPSWRREDDLGLKLATVLALADDPPSLTIQAHHVVEAQRLVAETAKNVPLVIEYVQHDLESEGLRRTREAIRNAGGIQAQPLARMMARVGVTHDRLRVYVETLVQSGIVLRVRGGSGAVTYIWKEGRS